MILSVIDLNGPKQVNAKVPESQIDQISRRDESQDSRRRLPDSVV